MKTICHNFYRKIIFNASALIGFLHKRLLLFEKSLWSTFVFLYKTFGKLKMPMHFSSASAFSITAN